MGNELTDGERLIKVETKVETIEGVVTRMETKLDAWQANYVTRHEMDEIMRSRDEDIRELKEANKEGRKMWREWLAVIIAGIAAIHSYWPHK